MGIGFAHVNEIITHVDVYLEIDRWDDANCAEFWSELARCAHRRAVQHGASTPASAGEQEGGE